MDELPGDATLPHGSAPNTSRTIDERIGSLELAVFGSKYQRVTGLIDLLPLLRSEVEGIKRDVAALALEIREALQKITDSRRFWIQLVAQAATLLAAVGALIVALKK